MSGRLIQIPLVKKACLAKQEWRTDAYSSPFVTVHYALFDFVGHPIFQLESILMTIEPPEVRLCGEVHIWRQTILLSVAHVNRTHFSAIPLRKSPSRG